MEPKIEGKKETNQPTSKYYLRDWSLWQLLDSLLPTGGFAHSYGLESAIQARLVNDPDDLHKFVINVLENTGSQLLPFVCAMTNKSNRTKLNIPSKSHSKTGLEKSEMYTDLTPTPTTTSHGSTTKTWHKLDRMLDAILSNEVARKASTTQGSAMLRVAASMFTELPYLKTLREESLGKQVVSYHHAPIFGLVLGLLGIDSETSQRAYMFVTMRDVISAATRLNLVGPQGAAIIQHQLAYCAEQILKKWMDRDVEDACQTVPLIDVVQGCHSYLFSRMFCS